MYKRQSEHFSVTNIALVSGASDIYGTPANEDEDTVNLVNKPTAITLLYFQATGQADAVLLSWATAVEIDNYGFYLMRSSTGQLGDAVRINTAIIPAQGSKSGGASYSYTDGDVVPGETYTYWLVDVDLNGKQTTHRETAVAAVAVGDQDTSYIYLPTVVRQ